MLRFSSYSDLGSDLLCLFYDNFLHFNFTILNLNEWFSIFLTYSCVSTCGRNERTEIFATFDSMCRVLVTASYLTPVSA